MAGRRAVREWQVATGVLLVAWLVAWLRLPPIARHTLWAEDGMQFLRERMVHGVNDTFLQPYSGYLHLVPRTIADVTVARASVADYATSMALLSCLVAGIVAAVVYACSSEVVPWRPARLVLALSTVLLPSLPVEVLGNAANVHWLFLWMAPWLLLHRPRGRYGAVGLGILGFLAGATEIQMLLFTPLVLHQLRDRRRWWPRGGVLLGLAAQVVTTLLHPREYRPGPSPHISSMAVGYVVNAVTGTWTGSSRLVGDLVADDGPALLAAVALPFVLATAYVLVRGRRLERIVAGTLVGASVAVWAAACEVNGAPVLDYVEYTTRGWHGFELARYGVVPGLLLTATLPLAAAVHRRRGGSAVPWAVLALVAVVAATGFTVPHTQRSDGPTWAHGLRLARQRCAAADRPPEVVVPTAPVGWSIVVRCDVVRSGRFGGPGA